MTSRLLVGLLLATLLAAPATADGLPAEDDPATPCDETAPAILCAPECDAEAGFECYDCDRKDGACALAFGTQRELITCNVVRLYRPSQPSIQVNPLLGYVGISYSCLMKFLRV